MSVAARVKVLQLTNHPAAHHYPALCDGGTMASNSACHSCHMSEAAPTLPLSDNSCLYKYSQHRLFGLRQLF